MHRMRRRLLILLLLLLIAAIVASAAAFLAWSWSSASRRHRGKEGFGGMTTSGQALSDWTLCTLSDSPGSPGSGFQFQSESLAQHIDTTVADPKCVAVRDLGGLLLNDGSCAVNPTLVADPANLNFVEWTNPLDAALAGGRVFTSVRQDATSGLPRCVLHANPGASAADAAALDAAMMKAAADVRSRKPWIVADYKRQEFHLKQVLEQAKVNLEKAKLRLASLKSTLARLQQKWDGVDTDYISNRAGTIQCTTVDLPNSVKLQQQYIADTLQCRTDISNIPTHAQMDSAFAETVGASLAIGPSYATLAPGCVVGKVQYHDAHPEVLGAGKDAWAYFQATGAKQGSGYAWVGDTC